MKAIFLLIFLSLGVYAGPGLAFPSSYEEMYRKTINELVDQLLEMQPLPEIQPKEEFKKAQSEVHRASKELRKAEKLSDIAIKEYRQADDNYYDELMRQYPEVFVTRDRISSERDAILLAYNKAKRELMMEMIPTISQQYLEAKHKVSEAKDKEREFEIKYERVLDKLIEQSLEVQYLQVEYDQSKYEYRSSLSKLIKLFPEVTEQERRYLQGEYYNGIKPSPEEGKLLAEKFPELWSLREWHKKAMEEYNKAIDLIKQNPRAQLLRAEWNEAQKIYDEAKKEKSRAYIEYRLLEKSIEKLPEVKGLKDKYEEKVEEIEEVNQALHALEKQSPEIQALKEELSKAEEEAETQLEKEEAKNFKYKRAVYEYKKVRYEYYKALKALVEQFLEVLYPREKVNQAQGN